MPTTPVPTPNQHAEVQPHDVIRKPTGHPSETHLHNVIKHHNIGVEAHNKGDKSKAKINFLTAQHHFKRFVAAAPPENLKRLNGNTVKSMSDLHNQYK
jgi:hypothetical protein